MMHPVCHTFGIFRLEREARLLRQAPGPEFKDFLPKIDTLAAEGDKLEDKILTYLSTEGTIDVQEMAELRSTIMDRLRALDEVKPLTVDQYNALVAGIPTEAGDVIAWMAVDAGVLDRTKMADVMREGSLNKPIAPEEPLVADAARSAAPVAPMAPVELIPDAGELRMGIEYAREQMREYERERRALVSRHFAGMRSLRGPARDQARARMASEVQQLRLRYGDPVSQYWASRGRYEVETGSSYARELYEEQGRTVTNAAEHPPQQRRIIFQDRNTGKNIGVFDEWTCNMIGKIPREEAVSLIQSHYGEIRDTGSGRAVLLVDGTPYLSDPAGSQRSRPVGGNPDLYRMWHMNRDPIQVRRAVIRDSVRDYLPVSPSAAGFAAHVHYAQRASGVMNPYLTSTTSAYIDATGGGAQRSDRGLYMDWSPVPLHMWRVWVAAST